MKHSYSSRSPAARWLCCWALLLQLPVAVQAQIVINEFMADNKNSVANETAFPDWIELYNRGSSPVNIGNWGLNDSTNAAPKFRFPPGRMIAAGAYLVVWCDSETNAPGLHTGFGLSDSGEYLRLTDANNQLIDSVVFGFQPTDYSTGREPNGSGGFVLGIPTANGRNQATTLAGITNLCLNEWAATNTSADDWLEIYNKSTEPVSITGIVIADTASNPGNKYVAITNLSFIGPKEFIQFMCDGKRTPNDHLNFAISNTGGDTLSIFAPNRVNVIDTVTAPGNDTNPGYWEADCSYGRLPDGAATIRKFSPGRTTPGDSNFLPLTNVVISEVLTHTAPPLEDAIELHNVTGEAVDISYWWLSNSREDYRKFQIPAGTSLPAMGYKVFYEMKQATGGFNTSGTGVAPDFTLNATRGDQLYLFAADTSGALLGERRSLDFGAAAAGVSFGRVTNSDGRVDIVAMTARTFGVDNPTTIDEFRQGQGAPNAAPVVGPLVISEIMYHPRDIGTNDNFLDEYVEIHNPTAELVYLYDSYGLYTTNGGGVLADGRTNTWRLRGDVDFDFPTNQSLAPGGYLLMVNFNPVTNLTQLTEFMNKYGVPDGVQLFGPYKGKLPNTGGTVELNRPDAPTRPDEPGYAPRILTEQVKYNDKAPWPTNSDGAGFALQRISMAGYGNEPANWMDAPPSPGRGLVVNNPPVILPLPEITTNEMRLVTFTATATDANAGQTVSFNLDNNAPAGCAITADGRFRWRPTEAQGPGTYKVRVWALDSGNPAQSNSVEVTVNVLEVNQTPVFSMREQWVKAGGSVSFKTGYDFDLPPNVLTYTMDPGTAAGAVLDPSSGYVTWYPPESQPAGIYNLTVSAVDNGVPPRSAGYTYMIHVLPSTSELVWVGEPVMADDYLQIRWPAKVGSQYRILYTDALTSPPAWQLLTTLTATEPNMVLFDTMGSGNRFFQVILVQ